MNDKQCCEYAEQLFSEKAPLNSLHQEIAENFYPERADFTYRRDLGDEFAAHLISSYPVLVRRDLSDQIGTMLRPTSKEWFHVTVAGNRREDDEAKRWLQMATRVQRRAMYDQAAMLNRATKEGDNDYVTFGQTVISAELCFDNIEAGPHLLHRCWHLRDMAWNEDRYGKVGNRFRRWKPTCRELYSIFKDEVHPSVKRNATAPGKKPLTKVDVLHMIVEADLYDQKDKRADKRPWVSIHYDQTNRHLIRATPQYSPYYLIARWQTVSGSQYAYSPATIIGLPDARLIQAMGRTLLEAGEKAVNPPMVATDQVIRSDISIYNGGITWVDRDYDERLGPALRSLENAGAKGIPFGLDMTADVRQQLAAVFYLNKLTMPQRAPEMTAYEVGQRIQQYIRDAMPIFEPMEADYNGQLCEMDFDLLLRGGAFGPPQEMPESLSNADVSFRFESPLHDAVDAQKAQKFM